MKMKDVLMLALALLMLSALVFGYVYRASALRPSSAASFPGATGQDRQAPMPDAIRTAL